MKRKIDKKQRQTIIYICMHARDLFNKLRWSEGVVCPYCGCKHIWHYKNGTYKCSHCGKRFSDTSNTIFHSTKVPLSYWIVCLYCLTMLKGCSSEEIASNLGITQKSAWYICHKIRLALTQNNIALTGDIMVDEVYLRGKWSSIIVPKKIEFMKKQGLYYPDDKELTWSKSNVQRAISEYKQPVFGMNDGNKIILRALPNRFDSTDLQRLIELYGQDINHLISDQSTLYTEIGQRGFNVIQMNHSKREFRNGEFSSNRIEGTFSHLKRRYRAHYVRPDKKYMQLYLNEFVFRWNNRESDALTRLAAGVNLAVACGRVTRRSIDSYNWVSEFKPRKQKHYETIYDWMDRDWPDFVSYLEINGVRYNRKEFERLKALRDARLNAFNIDESEMPF